MSRARVRPDRRAQTTEPSQISSSQLTPVADLEQCKCAPVDGRGDHGHRPGRPAPLRRGAQQGHGDVGRGPAEHRR